ncbi:efflux RND transporter permease subunit, partial [Micromonospora sp. NPDC047753]|uniref:MMPL family transporter n=1 Tax=Micromonospora sp. NPDC047753 TaxID=3154817 RepID=UPI0033E26F05
MSVFTRVARGRLAAWLTVAAAIVVGAAVFGTPQPDNPAPVSATGLSVQWQSTQVQRLQDQLPSSDVQPAIVVISRGDGGALSETDRATVGARADDLRRFAVGGQVSPAQVSPDGAVALVAVPLDTAGGQEVVTDTVTQLRETLADLPDGLSAEVTGSPAFTADLSSVFDGADVTLLVVTAAVVALLLLITYRSPFLWIVPLVVVAATEQLTLRAVDVIVPAVGINLQQGQVTGIASVLVFGAATDYALLLIARYREELRREEDRFAAMRAALRRTAEPILASGGTVVLGVLTLLLSEQETNRALAVACATGVVFAMLSALFVLPAVLVLFGRGLFWPFVPRVGGPVREGRLWGRLGAAVQRRPVVVATLATVLLGGLALGGLGIRTGLSETEQFRAEPEAVTGAQTLARAFPAGSTQPVAVITTPAAVRAVTDAATAVPGVASARPGDAGTAVAQVDVVLDAEPGTTASDRAIEALRAAVAAVPDSAPPAAAGSRRR